MADASSLLPLLWKEALMAIYQYRCDACDNDFELMQGMNDPALKECPRCDKPITRKIGPCAFHLKGDGWPGKEIKRENQKKGKEKA